MNSQTFCIQLIFFLCIGTLFVDAMQNIEVAANEEEVYENFYNYQCFPKQDRPNNLGIPRNRIGLQVSNRITHQLLTRIFAIFLREIFNYPNIYIIPYQYNGNLSSQDYEFNKLHSSLSLIKFHQKWPDMPMINMEVWMPSVGHFAKPLNVYESSQSITAGRFGWFVPANLPANRNEDTNSSLYFSTFLNNLNPYYDRFILDEQELNRLINITGPEHFFHNPLCMSAASCVTLLAEYENDTIFVVQHIQETGSLVNILWLGAKFRTILRNLNRQYNENARYKDKMYIVLHWTPSDITNADMEYKQITMQRCEELKSLQNSNCKYELTPLLKYYSKSLVTESNQRLLTSLYKFHISDAPLQQLLINFNTKRLQHSDLNDDIFNDVACNWMKKNAEIYSKWIVQEETLSLSIGGIFPITETSRGHQNLVPAVKRAVKAINQNENILSKYNLVVQENDGQCKADVVMKAFIHYFNVPNILGVLGPACSETVEPIAGISKHTHMAVISYSAEGASFVNRQTYPFFFRTIGSNRQYEEVYFSLMRRFNWRRVAALTEDGQKYTEYISHMETEMKRQNYELIMNKKFLSDVTSAEMNKYLVDLKQKHAKIIIADIHNRNAELALCEAYKLQMTAAHGYVWFLPPWLSKDWKKLSNRNNNSCTSEELKIAYDGHFSIFHTPFGESDAKMQENITVQQWLNSYDTKNESISNYIGFAYDAVWTYALAADKLLQENPDAINNLRLTSVVKRLVEIIWQTDFNGLSGRVRFGLGGSRITNINIMQWQQSKFIKVGKFMPELLGQGSSLCPNGGELKLNESSIKWLSGEYPPGDGTYDCSLSGLAEVLKIDCEKAAVILIAFICFISVIIISLVSFFFWKRRYDSKLRRSAKIMKNFGIDLLSQTQSKNTLDKWEIPKENVVVNRRLGEGAFGTVYGGEARIGNEAWTAVAVKTLKSGASNEDRIDFLSEAEAMKRFDHKNIVKLLAVCLQSEPIYTIMEFMLYGDLKTYLLARRHMANDKITEESDISSKRLSMYAMDVARGLSYLAEQKYVHRDIACRNCLVNAQRVVKLGDFGMARSIFDSDYYRFNRRGMLPVRWMAPESLALGLFTPASDIWAFGVVVYEIITFGSYPYQGMTNNQVMEYVKCGKTMNVPSDAKPALEALIKACWNPDAKKRPTANEIVDHITKNPRLLTSCIDFPGASVEMPETESDELELLPNIRKCSPNKQDSTLDILPQSNSTNAFEKFKLIDDINMVENAYTDVPTTTNHENIKLPPLTIVDPFSPITPDGYSIMSPLLMHQVSESSDSSQARLLNKSSAETLQQTPF